MEPSEGERRLSDSCKEAADLMGEDKRLIEELVTSVSSHLTSKKELYCPESKSSGETDELLLKQKRETIIKHLINEFFESRGKTDTTINNENWENINTAGSLPKKEEYGEIEICNGNTTGETIKTGDEISARPSVMKTSDCEEKKINSLDKIIERNEDQIKNVTSLVESGNFAKGDEEEKPENVCCIGNAKETSKTVLDENDKFVIKSESPDGFEKEVKEIVLTPEEEEKIKTIILLAESEYFSEAANKYENSVKQEKEGGDTSTSIKTKMEDNMYLTESVISKTLNYENKEESKECLNFVSSSDDLTITSKHAIKEAIEGTAVSKFNYTRSSAPMNDIRSSFYISRHVPIKYYQDRLTIDGWNPTQVLDELCVQCNWPQPEFSIIKFSFKEGYWFSVKVKDHHFNSREKGRSKKAAKSLASARVLKFLGFKFNYDPSKSCRDSIQPWTEKYSDHNSISLMREEERSEGFIYSRSAIAFKSDTDRHNHYKRERSSSNESRNSKILRTSSPETKLRRENHKRKRSREECSRPKSRREISPGFDHRKAYLRMEHDEHRRPRLVHERIAVTHVYDCNTLHPYRPRSHRSDRLSARHTRHP